MLALVLPLSARSGEVRLLERRVEIREKTEVEVDLPPGCVVTGIGVRAAADNITTLWVQYRQVLPEGSLGAVQEIHLGSEPDHACEAKVFLPEGWVIIGFGARGAPEWDVTTLRVWGRRWRDDGGVGEIRVWTDGREPDHGLERSILVKEPDRVLIGVGLRYHSNDIAGIYARSARVAHVPEGDRSFLHRMAVTSARKPKEIIQTAALLRWANVKAIAAPNLEHTDEESRLRHQLRSLGIELVTGEPPWNSFQYRRSILFPPSLGPVSIAALDVDRVQAELLSIWRSGAKGIVLDADRLAKRAGEPTVELYGLLLDDPFLNPDEVALRVIEKRVGRVLARTVTRAIERVPQAVHLIFSASGKPLLTDDGVPSPEKLLEIEANDSTLNLISREKETARWLLRQSRSEIAESLKSSDSPWLAKVLADLDELAYVADIWEHLVRAEILSRMYLINGSHEIRKAARRAIEFACRSVLRLSFGDVRPIVKAVLARLEVSEEKTELGRVIHRILELSLSGRDEEAAANFASLFDDERFRLHLKYQRDKIVHIANTLGSLGTNRKRIRVLWGGDGRWRFVKRAGRWCWMTTQRGPVIYFDVVSRPNRAKLIFEYYDDAPGTIQVHYDSDYPGGLEQREYHPAQPVEMKGSGAWRKAEVLLDRCVFAGRQNLGADLRILPDRRGVCIRAIDIEVR